MAALRYPSLALVLLLFGCASLDPKPIDVEMPAAQKHFIVRADGHQLPSDLVDLGAESLLLGRHLTGPVGQLVQLALRRGHTVQSGEAERIEPGAAH